MNNPNCDGNGPHLPGPVKFMPISCDSCGGELKSAIKGKASKNRGVLIPFSSGKRFKGVVEGEQQ